MHDLLALEVELGNGVEVLVEVLGVVVQHFLEACVAAMEVVVDLLSPLDQLVELQVELVLHLKLQKEEAV